MRAPSRKPAARSRARSPGQPEDSASGNRKGVELHWILRSRVELTGENMDLFEKARRVANFFCSAGGFRAGVMKTDKFSSLRVAGTSPSL